MAVYTDVFLATEAALQEVHLEIAHPSKYFPTILAKYCTNFELAHLDALLDGQDSSLPLDERLEAFSLLQEKENCRIYQLPDRLVKRLADLMVSGVEDIAHLWATTEELRPGNGRPVDPAPLRDYLQRLTQLAMLAQQEGRHLYLWISI